jgi:hypothetical protein
MTDSTYLINAWLIVAAIALMLLCCPSLAVLALLAS